MNTLAAVKIAAGLLDRQLEMFPKCPDDHVYIRYSKPIIFEVAIDIFLFTAKINILFE